ncbi:MAG: DUF2938 domain-containing protein [Gemmatimonadaceae bacterium]
MEHLVRTITIGFLATAVMDLWGMSRERLLGYPRPNYRLIGRWIAYMPRGRFRHHPILASAPVPGELVIGWMAHYLIGTTFAALLTSVWGLAWLQRPTLGPALLVGVVTVLAPFLLMQPGMGAGIAASRTPSPATARLHSLLTHTVFGFGLYLAGWATHLLS